MQKTKFTALINFISEKEGGRKTPTSSGYRSELKMSGFNELVLGEFNFLEADLVFAGDSISSEITLINFENGNKKIYSGLDFDFYEGEHLMGKGIITNVNEADS